jgi:hypothetical protein
MNEERFNKELRGFLKKVGVTSQRELEKAVWARVDSGELPSGPLHARMTLRIDELNLEHVVEGTIGFD